MNEDEIRLQLQSILDDVAPGASLDDAGPGNELREALDIDSFDFLRVVQKLEENLGLRIPESDYPELNTLPGLIDYFSNQRRPL